MTAVLTPIVVQYLGGARWLLQEPYACVSQRLGRIDIPAGFNTDFNSVPRILWNIFPPADYLEAALPHDFLYAGGHLRGVAITRADADAVHREFVAWAGSPADPLRAQRSPAPRWKRTAYHYALRAAGWWPWWGYRYQDARRAGVIR